MIRCTDIRTTTIFLLLLLQLLASLGCVNAGSVALDTSGETIQFRGQLLLGEDEHEGEVGHEEGEEEGAPITGLPIALVVGLEGVADETLTSVDGEFSFLVPPGEYHLGISLPANFADAGASQTAFLIHAEASEEPVGFEIVIVPEPEEGAWHIHGHIFDDEDGDGLLTGDEAILEELEVDVPFGSQQDLVLNPEAETEAPEEDGHGHSHG